MRWLIVEGFYKGIQSLQKEGHRVNAISPQAAIYLTVQFDLQGQKTAEGKTLNSTKDVTKYLLDEAKLAIVPFYAFRAYSLCAPLFLHQTFRGKIF